jgi:hypothetical protein
LSDRPQQFQDYPNVRAIKHRCRGVLPYHERRYAIHYALNIAPSVMYLDADVRICAPIPDDLEIYPGLTARTCCRLQKHMRQNPPSRHKKYVIEKMAKKMDIDDLDDPELKFINEFLFVVTAYEGREQDFLRYWGELAIYADTLGLHKHPTYAMALAARKSGFPVYRSEMNGLDFFDDRVEKYKLNRGKSTPGAKSIYFQQQYELENPSRTLTQRLLRKIVQKSSLYYNKMRVQLTAARSPSLLIDYPSINSKN